ncbi:hypothetical protein M153_1100018673 [Pseudoloma neurophilia]|uniref:Uncharacterized protein n=1 Tax=Pseudoloma neurophilia TaxID=146866 RepID=A0A0R0M0X9_9MICR|nr:hypothetical protein M153_1100018673 [Pseudoloma neurophilia]
MSFDTQEAMKKSFFLVKIRGQLEKIPVFLKIELDHIKKETECIFKDGFSCLKNEADYEILMAEITKIISEITRFVNDLNILKIKMDSLPYQNSSYYRMKEELNEKFFLSISERKLPFMSHKLYNYISCIIKNSPYLKDDPYLQEMYDSKYLTKILKYNDVISNWESEFLRYRSNSHIPCFGSTSKDEYDTFSANK